MIAKDIDLAAGLYLVATPIGNARDITLRALDVLSSADVLAAEDTRTLRKLLEIHGISLGGRQMIAYHDHSNQSARQGILDLIKAGRSVAYASEAGTPLVADPGFQLARDAFSQELAVIPLPGPSAALAALSVAGLPSNIFTFCGFAPTAAGARKSYLNQFKSQTGSLIFFESPKRIEKFLSSACDVFGADRPAALCRELTKKFEDSRRGTLGELLEDPGTLKGEFVVVIGPDDGPAKIDEEAVLSDLKTALTSMTVKDASAMVANKHGLKKREIYQMALSLKEQ